MSSNPVFQQILLDVKDGIATITLNRPDKMNAFTSNVMAKELVQAFDITDSDDDVKVVILTGAGEKAFCAGADLSAGAQTFDFDTRKETVPSSDSVEHPNRDSGGMVSLRIFDSLKPVIAAINGVAVGIGVTMTLPADIRLASENARFGFVFARRGIVPEAASSWFLPRLVGISQAVEWCYSGRVFPASEAKAGGLVKEVYPQEELMDAAKAIAREIIDNTAPVSISLTRRMMWEMMTADHPMEAHQIDSRSVYERGRTQDAKEGVMSFLEKRAPNYPEKVSQGLAPHYPWYPARDFKWPKDAE